MVILEANLFQGRGCFVQGVGVGVWVVTPETTVEVLIHVPTWVGVEVAVGTTGIGETGSKGLLQPMPMIENRTGAQTTNILNLFRLTRFPRFELGNGTLKDLLNLCIFRANHPLQPFSLKNGPNLAKYPF